MLPHVIKPAYPRLFGRSAISESPLTPAFPHIAAKAQTRFLCEMQDAQWFTFNAAIFHDAYPASPLCSKCHAGRQVPKSGIVKYLIPIEPILFFLRRQFLALCCGAFGGCPFRCFKNPVHFLVDQVGFDGIENLVNLFELDQIRIQPDRSTHGARCTGTLIPALGVLSNFLKAQAVVMFDGGAEQTLSHFLSPICK